APYFLAALVHQRAPSAPARGDLPVRVEPPQTGALLSALQPRAVSAWLLDLRPYSPSANGANVWGTPQTRPDLQTHEHQRNTAAAMAGRALASHPLQPHTSRQKSLLP